MSGPADESKAPGPEPQKAEPQAAPDYYGQLLKLKAEFENFRKRSDRERPELIRLGRAEVVSKLLPIYDLLVHLKGEIDALASAPGGPALAAGMTGIFKEFEKIFKEEGVRAMEPLGAPLDPMHHEALGSLETDSVPEGHVAEVLQSGFLFKEKVLRPAKVRIAKNKRNEKNEQNMEEKS